MNMEKRFLRHGNTKPEAGDQLELDFHESGIKSIENFEHKDKRGRNRKDIEIESKSLKQEVLNSIKFQNGEFYIEGILADEWIKNDRELYDEKDPNDYLRGQY